MNFELTQRVRKVLPEWDIPVQWMKRTFFSPEFVLPNPNDPSVEQRFRKIPEFGGSVLRVAVNTIAKPNRVVSEFCDRQTKEKL